MERWPGPQEAPGDDGPQLHRACLFLIATVLSPAVSQGVLVTGQAQGFGCAIGGKEGVILCPGMGWCPGIWGPVKLLCCAVWHDRVHLSRAAPQMTHSQAGTSATQKIRDDASEARGMPTQISGNPMGLRFLKK